MGLLKGLSTDYSEKGGQKISGQNSAERIEKVECRIMNSSSDPKTFAKW